uniref:Uncharacterized protein n=1 Tax=Cacopsylla melanoneura TaxID=428564 RepID=A0A8D8Z7P8_9HEMI
MTMNTTSWMTILTMQTNSYMFVDASMIWTVVIPTFVTNFGRIIASPLDMTIFVAIVAYDRNVICRVSNKSDVPKDKVPRNSMASNVNFDITCVNKLDFTIFIYLPFDSAYKKNILTFF